MSASDYRLHLRPATMEDIDFLDALYTESMQRYLNAHSLWESCLFRKRFIPEQVKVVLIDKEKIGLLKVFTEVAEIFLADIQICVDYRNRGIGRALVSSVLNRATGEDRSVRLRVLKGNPAIRLYQRLKFEVYEETPTEYLMRAWPGESRKSQERFVPFAQNGVRRHSGPMSPMNEYELEERVIAG